MGHREDLLEGAKRCLLEKGFARTTARDIVKESGTNLGSIGYHYGSKDALLAQAFIALVEDVGDSFGEEALAGDGVAPAGSLERFQEMWGNVIRTFPESRAVWMLNFEFILQADRMPEAHEIVKKALQYGRSGLVPMFSGRPEDELDDGTVNSEGRFYHTILCGLLVQWLFDPESATDAGQLTEGLRRVIEAASKSPAGQGTGDS
jgi:AcrR family transcriptional regulator